MQNKTFFNFTLLAKNCTLSNFVVRSLVNSTECFAPKYDYYRDFKYMETPNWHSANDRFRRVLTIFFITSCIDVFHSIIRIVRGINRKEKQENDLDMLE